MIKKILLGVIILGVICLAGWKLFFSKDDVSGKVKDVRKNLVAYHIEANMELSNNEETRNYFVTTDYKKENDNDLFRVSLLDKNINQEQIMLKNPDGVFVLTPMLNQVYKFKGDWPLNNPKPYLYHSLIDVFNGEHEIKKVDDGFLVSAISKYPNSPSWAKQEIKFTKDMKPVMVDILNSSNETVGKVTFTEVDMNPTFADNYFDVEANMVKARENLSTENVGLEFSDLPLLPTNAKYSAELSEKTLATINGQSVYILSYTGTDNFTIVQQISEKYDTMKIIEVSGDLIETISGIAIKDGSKIKYVNNGVTYDIYSDSLNVDKIIDIVNGMETNVKK